MAGLGSLLGEGQSASQFLMWGVAYGFAQALLQPEFEALQQLVWRNQAVRVLSPADLADMVIRNIRTEDDAAGEAADSGIDADRFHDMVLDTGEPPGLELGLEMLRRGIIQVGDGTPGEATFSALVATSRLRPEWLSSLLAAQEVPISAADAVEAFIRGQISEADAKTEAFATGINSDRFDILANTAGRPPALGEALELLRRGIIQAMGLGPDETTFQQAIAEGDTKDKWLQQFLALAAYIPPPRSIATLQSHGVIDTATAAQLYQQNGLSPQLAGIYAASAVAVKVAAHKQATEAQVLKLYYDRLIDGPAATGMLENLGYDQTTAAYVLELQDFARAASVLNGAVSTVGRLYVAHKVTRAATIEALQALDLPAAAVSQYVGVWDTEVVANVKTLTEGQITAAFFYGVKDQAWCQQALQDIGYTAHDAWVILSDRSHGPLPGEPPAGPTAGLGATTYAGDVG